MTSTQHSTVKLPRWLALVLIVVVLGLTWWLMRDTDGASEAGSGTNATSDSTSEVGSGTSATSGTDADPSATSPTFGFTAPGDSDSSGEGAETEDSSESASLVIPKPSPPPSPRPSGDPSGSASGSSGSSSSEPPSSTQGNGIPAGEGPRGVDTRPWDGIDACFDRSLPPELEPVVWDVEDGGPFDYPDRDGSTFGNYEGILPDERRGYYREYTVETPGLSHRGAKRIVTGGQATDPEVWYYTDDHYESFCEFAP